LAILILGAQAMYTSIRGEWLWMLN
jgi:hypothetical protein